MTEKDFVSDAPFGFDEAEFLREWEQADAHAVEVLRTALPDAVAATPPADELRAAADRIRAGIAAGQRPYDQLARAAGLRRALPADDIELWVAATGGLIAMREQSGMDVDEESALMSLDHGDWVGAVIGLVRAGVDAPADATDLVGYADACAEVDGVTEPEDTALVAGAFDTILRAWEATGAVTADRRLSALGAWGLPRALAHAWDNDFDTLS